MISYSMRSLSASLVLCKSVKTLHLEGLDCQKDDQAQHGQPAIPPEGSSACVDQCSGLDTASAGCCIPYTRQASVILEFSDTHFTSGLPGTISHCQVVLSCST